MSNLFINPFGPAFASTGVIASGALLKAYVSGTSTRTTLYANAEKTSFHEWPLAADSSGQFPPVYLDEAVTYRFVLTTSIGAQIGNEIDPYYSTDQQIASLIDDAAAAAEAAAAPYATAASDSADEAAVSAAQAAASALTSGAYPNSAASAVPKGVTGTTSLVGGSGGTNGTFALGFSGGGGSNATGTFTVTGGALASIDITGPGYGYTSAPTLSFTASAGLTGASATAVVDFLIESGEYYWATSADGLYLTLYQNASGTATATSTTVPTLSGLQDVVPDLDKAKSRSDLLATSALSGEYTTLILQTESGANSSANSDFARAFDASSTTTATTLAVGSVIDAVVFRIIAIATTTKLRVRVYERPLSSAALNTAPPNGVDDVLVSTSSDFTPEQCGLVTADGARTTGTIALSTSFTVRSGYTYVFRLDARTAADADIGMSMAYATVSAVAQRLAGWYHATAGAGSWTNMATTRQILIGAATADAISLVDLKTEHDVLYTRYAEAVSSPLSTLEEQLTDPDGWRHVKWMGGETTLDGLELLFGETSWPANLGQYGVDYGNLTAEGSMTAGSSHPAWNSTRIDLKNTVSAVAGRYTITQYDIDGTITINANAVHPVYVTDCVMRGRNYVDFRAMSQSNDPLLYPVYFDHCLLTEYDAQCYSMSGGEITRCLLQDSEGDALSFAGTASKLIDQNYMRLLGQNDPATHADVIQAASGENFKIYRNTCYMPGTGSTYDEATYGSTSVLRLVAEGGAVAIKTGRMFGNLFVGGGYTGHLMARSAGSSVNDIIFANNIWSPPDYRTSAVTPTVNNVFYPNTIKNKNQATEATGSVGEVANVMFYNDRVIGSLSGSSRPMTDLVVDGLTANGIWHFDKSLASEVFIYLGKKWGYLDWNGDIVSAWDRTA